MVWLDVRAIEVRVRSAGHRMRDDSGLEVVLAGHGGLGRGVDGQSEGREKR